MNPFEKMKNKLLMKPVIHERKKVEVVLREKPIIVDETNKGFDRSLFINRLKIKPVINPNVGEIDKEMEELKRNQQKLEKELEKEPVNEEVKEEEEVEEEEEKPKRKEPVKEKEPVKQRKTKKVEKGVAVLGPETIVQIGDTELISRIPKKTIPINIKVSSYYMNNREIFVNFINSLFEPYRLELQQNTENISCDDIGQTTSKFALLTHQKIVRDYMNLYTPYRGLLLFHGLGSGKTCSSIAIAEGMKSARKVYIMTPASLRRNYIEEIKKCGDLIYRKNQFWEWISLESNPELLDP